MPADRSPPPPASTTYDDEGADSAPELLGPRERRQRRAPRVRAGAGVRRRRREFREVRGARGGAAPPVVRGAAGDGGAGVRVQAGRHPPGALRRPPLQGRPRRRLRLRLVAALSELMMTGSYIYDDDDDDSMIDIAAQTVVNLVPIRYPLFFSA